ncbi:MAG: hypothetical protein DWQ02_04390 [Bacteroidetes bacterium]|nr:MAG: hypothetical protein DWQ02_04390 [Bacteroidota bacterium]
MTVTSGNGCQAFDSFILAELTPPTVNITGPTSICSGSTTTLSVPDIFNEILWNTGEITSVIQVSQSGTYAVTVIDNNGCSGTAIHSLETGESLTPEITIQETGCNGTALLDAGGGFDSYLWSNGATTPQITVNTNGAFTVSVSDVNGCFGSNSVDVIIPEPPQVTINGPAAACDGSSIVLTADPGFTTYQWSNGETTESITLDASSSASYSITVTNSNGCPATEVHDIQIFPLPTVGISGPEFLCQGASDTLSAIGSFQDILWSTGETTSEIQVSENGNYQAIVTDQNGCSNTVTHQLVTGDSLSVDISLLSPECSGIANLEAEAGFSSYHWSTGDSTQNIQISQSGNYSLTVSDTNGCSAESALDYEQMTVPEVLISGPEFICTGFSDTLLATGNYQEILWNTGDTEANIIISLPGVYQATVTDSNGCTALAEHMVEVGNSLDPQIILTGPDCDGNAIISAHDGFSTYTWSNGNSSHEFSVNTDGTYSVTVTDENGCTGNGSVELNIPLPPQVAIDGPPEACEGIEEFLTANSGFVNYLWSTGATTETISVNDSDTYSVTVTDINGCTATTSVDFESLPLPSVQITGPEHLCNGESAMLSISGTFDQIQWNTGDSSSEVMISQAGTYTVNVTDTNGCMASTEHMVEVDEPPIPQIILTGPDCEGNAMISIDEGYSSYLWSNGNSSSELAVNTSGTYSITVTDGNGCTGSESVDINIPAPLQVAINGPSEGCEGIEEFLTADPVFISYLWSTGATTETISVNDSDTYSVTVTDDNGCTATVSIDFESLPLPEVQIAGPEHLCNGDSAMLSISGTFDQIQWNTGDSNSELMISQAGTYAVIVTDTNGCMASTEHMVQVEESPIPQIVLTGPDCDGNAMISVDEGYSGYLWSNGSSSSELAVNSSGTYSVTVTNENGCVGTGSLDLNIPAPLQVAISGPTEACEGVTEFLSADAGFASYLWSTGSTTETISVNVSDTYSLTVTDDNGCTATVSLDFESLPLPEAQITGPEFICANDQAVLSVEGSFSQVVWNNGQIGNTLDISQPGTYSALVTAANGCESSVMTAVLGYPNVDFELEATPTCKDESNGTIEIKNLSGSAPFLFYLSNYEPQASPVFTGLPNGTYSILVMDDNGCTMELPLEIREVPPLEIAVSDQEISCEQSSVLLQPEVISGDLANLQWSWSTGSIDPWIEVEDVGRYVVEVSDKCSVQEYGIQVNYAAELLGKNLFYVPNVFSPNNDGVNDYFQVFSKPDVNILEFELRVFDRWGEQLFVTNDVDGKWDGVFKNVRLQPAVFVWYIIARVDQCGMREFEIKDKGDVLILR